MYLRYYISYVYVAFYINVLAPAVPKWLKPEYRKDERKLYIVWEVNVQFRIT